MTLRICSHVPSTYSFDMSLLLLFVGGVVSPSVKCAVARPDEKVISARAWLTAWGCGLADKASAYACASAHPMST